MIVKKVAFVANDKCFPGSVLLFLALALLPFPLALLVQLIKYTFRLTVGEICEVIVMGCYVDKPVYLTHDRTIRMCKV